MSLDEIRRLMAEPNMSDEEADAIRASCYELADIIIEDWLRKRDAEELAGYTSPALLAHWSDIVD